MKQLKPMILGGVAAFAALSATNVFAQDKPDGLYHGTASLGAAFSTGAVNNTTISANFDTARKTEIDKLSFYGLAARGSTKVSGTGTAVTSDLYRLGGRYDRDFNKQLFGYVSGELERNGVTDLDLRAGAYVGVGYHVIATPATTFDLFGGVGYNRYKYKGIPADGAGELMLGEESAHKVSESTTFKQKLVVYPSFDSDLGYRAQWDATLGVAMGGGWNMNTGATIKYANKVYVGKKTESLLTVGIGYKF
jgi:putative salt-induced outer membrane protein